MSGSMVSDQNTLSLPRQAGWSLPVAFGSPDRWTNQIITSWETETEKHPWQGSFRRALGVVVQNYALSKLWSTNVPSIAGPLIISKEICTTDDGSWTDAHSQNVRCNLYPKLGVKIGRRNCFVQTLKRNTRTRQWACVETHAVHLLVNVTTASASTTTNTIRKRVLKAREVSASGRERNKERKKQTNKEVGRRRTSTNHPVIQTTQQHNTGVERTKESRVKTKSQLLCGHTAQQPAEELEAYLEGDDDGLEVAAPPLDVVAHLLDVDVVERSVDLVHDEEGCWSEAGHDCHVCSIGK